MSFDLRLPVGLMFSVFGLILLGVGLFGSPALTEQSLGINMNLWCGVFQIVFGLLMLLPVLSKRKKGGNFPDAL